MSFCSKIKHSVSHTFVWLIRVKHNQFMFDMEVCLFDYTTLMSSKMPWLIGAITSWFIVGLCISALRPNNWPLRTSSKPLFGEKYKY